jgi:hypothetical protein
LIVAGLAHAQFFGPPPPDNRPGKVAAPIDLTGYWVSVVTEDWRFRMVTPPKGDFVGVWLNGEGRKVGMAWDPAKDEAAGEQCKAYGAAGIMRIPGRFHITWEDDNTLKIETDAGTQTRVLHFHATPPAGTAPSWQGYSVASWERQISRSRGGQGQPGAGDSRGGSLKVVTTNLRPGYLRTNGAPYSDKTTVTEYYDLVRESNGDQWVIVKTIVEDPTYLFQPFITSTNLKKQADASGWNPTPCSAR